MCLSDGARSVNLLTHDEIVLQLRQLPALPAVINEVLASFGNDEADIGRICLLVARDQSLTARLLRVANSSFYGLQCRVATINEAVVVLGFRAVRSMLLTLSVNGVFDKQDCPGFEPRAYTRHCVGVGLAARAIAETTGRNPDLAFAGGVLHDIGQLVLASIFGAAYAQVLAYRREHDCPLAVAERDILGTDHAIVGGLLADAWNFPASLRSAIVEHHAPSAASADSLADLIHVADAVAHGLGLAGDDCDLVMPVDPTAWQRLGLDRVKLASILPRVVDGLEEASQAFSA